MTPAHDEALRHDPTAKIDHHRPDDRFIPISPDELAHALAADKETFGAHAGALRAVAQAIEDITEQQAATFEHCLGVRYAPFNPDRDTIRTNPLPTEGLAEQYAELGRTLTYLLQKANFGRLSNVQIEKAIEAANSSGLRVKLDPSRVEQLEVWVRGLAKSERRRRTWRKPIKGMPHKLDVYRRLVVVSRLKKDPHVLLKMFKEIPVADVEALLPHAQVSMSWFDRIKLMGGGAGMVGSTAMKLLTPLALSKLIWILLLGFAMLLFRTFAGYRNVRTQRDLQRTTHLYYQNLANNAGVINLLISRVAQEETKEALLAYAFLWVGNPTITSPETLKCRVEQYLHSRFGVTFQFDVPDALESLGWLGLWSDQQQMAVIAPESAAEQLREHWRTRRMAHYHQRMAELVDEPECVAAQASANVPVMPDAPI